MSKTEIKITKKKAAGKKKAATKKVASKKPVAKKSASKKKAAPATKSSPRISPRERYEMIATMAFYRAEQRDFEPGHDVEDWLDCERIVDQMLLRQ